MNTSFADGVQFAWDATSISLAETCLKKYQYVMIDGWRAPAKSVHLLFGGWYASAMEMYHKLLAGGTEREAALLEVVKWVMIETWEHPKCAACGGKGWIDTTEEAQKSMKWAGHVDWARQDPCQNCGGLGILEGGQPWDGMHNFKTRANLVRTIVWYIDHFADDPMETVILSNGKPAVELSFSIPLDNGLILTGHLDRVARYSGDLYINDQKTTGATLSPYYFKQFKPDTQMTTYTFAGKIVLDEPVRGVVIDAAQIAVGFSRFERDFIQFTESELKEWYDEAMYHIEAAREATRKGFFPRNRASCNNYGGCEFRDICALAPSQRQTFLKSNFDKGQWDPLERR